MTSIFVITFILLTVLGVLYFLRCAECARYKERFDRANDALLARDRFARCEAERGVSVCENWDKPGYDVRITSHAPGGAIPFIISRIDAAACYFITERTNGKADSDNVIFFGGGDKRSNTCVLLQLSVATSTQAAFSNDSIYSDQ